MRAVHLKPGMLLGKWRVTEVRKSGQMCWSCGASHPASDVVLLTVVYDEPEEAAAHLPIIEGRVWFEVGEKVNALERAEFWRLPSGWFGVDS